MAREGTVLAGRYRIERHIGSGAMGTVYLARDEVLDRDVAVKSVHAEPDSEHGRRIMREARLGAGLRHPHLVTVYDVVEGDGTLLLVMEHVAGETLADALRKGRLEDARVLSVLRGVADALDHAHQRGIVHRDVKPANVLLGSNGAVKLADLGIATSEDVTRITSTGGMLGTVAYMAPEQFEPGPVTPAADVFALAAVAFQSFTGRPPRPGATAFEVIGKLRDGSPPPDVREARPELPEGVAAALIQGMDADPGRRPATAGELVGALDAALAPAEDPRDATQPMRPVDPPTEPRPPVVAPVAERAPAPAPSPRRSPARSRSRRSALIPLGLVALIGVVLAVVLLSGGGEGEEEPARAERTQTQARTGETAAAPPPTTATAAAKPPGPATPVDAVRAFYTRAAEGDLRGSWRLAGPKMRAAFGGSFDTFQGDLGSLRSITFRRIEQTATSGDSATVTVETLAEHTDRTERCSGTVQAVRGSRGRWLVDPLGISCVAA